MLGVVSSIAADAGYLVLVPLGAAAFHSLGRHPLAGLAAAFSGVAAVFLVNLFVTPTDALLAEMTNDAIRLVDPAREVTLVGNLYFMIASSILMGIVCTHPDREGGRAAPRPLRRRRAGRGADGADPDAVARPALRRLGAARLRRRRRPADRCRRARRCAIPRPARSSPARRSCPGLIVLISALFFTVGFAYGKGAGHGEGPDRGDQHGGQDLLRHGRADLPAAGHRPVHRLLQLHQHRDGAGGEPRRLPRDGAARRRQLHHHLRAGDLPDRPDPHRRGGEMGDLRAGVHPALHAARRRPEPGARRLPGRRLAGERHHAAERLSRRDGRLRREVPEGRRHRHHRLADAALYRGAAGALDRCSWSPGTCSACRSGRPDQRQTLGETHVRPRQGARPPSTPTSTPRSSGCSRRCG